MTQPEPVELLRKRGYHRGMTLFLGAGVSMGSGLPSWKQLVARMYFTAVKQLQHEGEQFYPHYLYAVADWYVERNLEPLHITARKVCAQYQDDEFVDRLWRTLYRRFLHGPERQIVEPPTRAQLQEENPTLRSIVKLCRPNPGGHRRIRAVVSYNYDDLVEMALPPGAAHPTWQPGPPVDVRKHLPVYHVHGYIPLQGERRSRAGEIVFAEKEYHTVAHSPNAWSNLVQLQCLSSTTGLFIGSSITDPNLRRLLEAARAYPERRPHFALMPNPSLPRPCSHEADTMHQHAMERARKFHLMADEPTERHLTEMDYTLSQVDAFDKERQEQVLGELGIQPVWFNDHAEIPRLIDRILS